jgi:DNA-binding PadR family transcriptional regulator
MYSKISPRELFVLGTISRRRIHGHEIMSTIRVSNASTWLALSEKHIYYILRKLAREELISETEERPGPAPPRKVYDITDKGRQTLREMLQSERLQRSFAISPFDAVIGMLAFTNVLTNDEAIDVLRARRNTISAHLCGIHPKEASQEITERFGGMASSLFEKARLLLQTELRWLDDLIKTLETKGWQNQKIPDQYL